MRRTPSGGSTRTLWNQRLEGFVRKRLGLFFRSNLEERVDPCLDRPLMKKVAAEGVDRADARKLQFLERAVQPIAFLARRFRPRLLDLAAEAQLHLAGRLFGEGDRDDPVERAGASADQPDDPTDQRGCLAGSRRRLDEEARAELGQDPAACLSVGEIGHGDARTARSGSRRSCGFRAARRSSCGPQTTR